MAEPRHADGRDLCLGWRGVSGRVVPPDERSGYRVLSRSLNGLDAAMQTQYYVQGLPGDDRGEEEGEGGAWGWDAEASSARGARVVGSGTVRRVAWCAGALLATAGLLLGARLGIALPGLNEPSRGSAARLPARGQQAELTSLAGRKNLATEWALRQEGRIIYAVGADGHVYKQELSEVTVGSEWELAVPGKFVCIAVDGDHLYGVGSDHKVYVLPLDGAVGSGNWTLASAAHAAWIAIRPGGGDASSSRSVIFKIGDDGKLYRSAAAALAPDTLWEGPLCRGTRLRSLAVDGDVLFAVGQDGKVYTQSVDAVGHAAAWQGPISDESNIASIAVFGDSVLGVGLDGRVYRQRTSDTWTAVGGGRMRSIAVTEPRARWLRSDAAWSRPGATGDGPWTSSVAKDEFGDPDTEGPANLLGGGHWRTRWGEIRDQWMVLDLGRPMVVEAVRVLGAPAEPKKNPRTVRWQSGASLTGPWTDTVAVFESPESGTDWAAARLDPPVASRWWRLYIVDSWGDGGPGQDMLIVSGLGIKAYAAPASAGDKARDGGAGASGCSDRFMPPPRPDLATDLNGVALPDVCFEGDGPHHVFAIGDWGGIVFEPGKPPRPADHRSQLFPEQQRPFVVGADDCAQVRVAEQMRKRAPISRPDYVLNLGDNFYWGGVTTMCGARLGVEITDTGQWGPIFEDVYRGPGLDYVQWLGVLGNHDYGGFMFTAGWDQVIGYTWADTPTSTGRWVTPALYWRSKVKYPDFAIDYFFLDTNAYDAFEPGDFTGHNLCSMAHNPTGATCAPQGPESIWDCPRWFEDLWAKQTAWLEDGLSRSEADWQVIVTHFPPEWGKEEFWKPLCRTFGVDLLVHGHRHRQETHAQGEEDNFLGDTAYIVTGGGGGITSQDTPDADGEDDQYGFMDLALSLDTIEVEAISHGGQIRSRISVHPRYPDPPLPVSELQARRRKESAMAEVGNAMDRLLQRQEGQAGAASVFPLEGSLSKKRAPPASASPAPAPWASA